MKTTHKVLISVLGLIGVLILIPIFFLSTHYSGSKLVTVHIEDMNKYTGCNVFYKSFAFRELMNESLKNEILFSNRFIKVQTTEQNTFQGRIRTEGYSSLFNLIRTYQQDSILAVAIVCPDRYRIIKTAELPNLKNKDNELITVK